MGRFAERRHQTAPVAGAGGKHDVARLDAVERNCGEVGVQGFSPQASRDDGDSLTGGDELELVLDGVDERAVGRRGSVGAGIYAPVRVPGRIRQPGHGLVGDVVEGGRFLAGQAVAAGDQQHAGLVVQDRHVQSLGADWQPGYHGVYPVIEQGLARLVPWQVQAVYLGVGMLVPQLPQRRGDDEA